MLPEAQRPLIVVAGDVIIVVNDTVEENVRGPRIVKEVSYRLLYLPKGEDDAVGPDAQAQVRVQYFAGLEHRLGVAGQPVFWTLIAFGLVVLRLLFGGEATLLPLLLGLAVGFLLLSLVTRIGFMRWFWESAGGLPFFESIPLNFAVGAGVLFWGLLLSYLQRFRVLLQFVLLVVLPFAVLLAGNALKIL